jgi:hypothetical protein
MVECVVRLVVELKAVFASRGERYIRVQLRVCIIADESHVR